MLSELHGQSSSTLPSQSSSAAGARLQSSPIVDGEIWPKHWPTSAPLKQNWLPAWQIPWQVHVPSSFCVQPSLAVKQDVTASSSTLPSQSSSSPLHNSTRGPVSSSQAV